MADTGADPYTLLGVPRDASPEAIRQAYERELNSAHRSGAFRQAEALSRAYDTLSDPRRRLIYDRHGVAPLAERVPGTFQQPVPWRAPTRPLLDLEPPGRRAAGSSPRASTHATRRPRGWALFAAGLIAGLLLAYYAAHHTWGSGPPSVATQPTRVTCGLPNGSGYTWLAQPGQAITCTNGASPVTSP